MIVAREIVGKDPLEESLGALGDAPAQFSGGWVVIDLSACHDLLICNDQLDAGATVVCSAKTTRKFTNASGSVTFTVLGGSNGAGNASTLLAGGYIFANGTQLSRPTVAADPACRPSGRTRSP